MTSESLNPITIEQFVLEAGFTPPADRTVPDPHIAELIQIWDSMQKRRSEIPDTEANYWKTRYMLLKAKTEPVSGYQCQTCAGHGCPECNKTGRMPCRRKN